MKNLIFCAFFVVYISIINLSAQPVNTLVGDITMPPPSAASINRYQDVPVSYFTGVPNVSIPIYTVEDGMVSLPLNLSYHAGGIRVADMASWVGLSWSLSVSQISRTTMGRNDDLSQGYFNTYDDLVLPMQANNQTSTQQMFDVARGTLDAEPDLFTLSLPDGTSAKFVFDKNQEPFFMPQQDIDLEIVRRDNQGAGNDGEIIRIIVTQTNGTKYVFGTLDSDTESYKGLDYVYYTNVNYATIAPSSWHLRKIISYNGQHEITLDYEPEKYSYRSLAACTLTYVDGGQTSGASDIDCSPISLPDYTAITRNHFVGWRLKEITSSTQTVSFKALTNRTDLDSYSGSNNSNYLGGMTKRLDRIDIQTGNFHKEFVFNYDYYGNLSCGTSNNITYLSSEQQRLRLLSVQEKGLDDNGTVSETINPYVFNYHSDNLPNRLSKATDHWGFYNGACDNKDKFNIPTGEQAFFNGSIQSPPAANADRDTDEASMLNGILNKIHYPEGGSVAFTYGANEHNQAVQETQPGSPVFGFFTCAVPGTSCCNGPFQKIEEDSFTAEELAGATFRLSVDDIRSYCSASGTQNPRVTISVREKNTQNGVGQFSFDYNNGGACNASICCNSQNNCYRVKPLSDLGNFQADILYEFTLTVDGIARGEFTLFAGETTSTTFQAVAVGGLRIEEMRIHDGVRNFNDIVRTYDYTTGGNPDFSSGKLYFEPVYHGYQYDVNGDARGLTYFANPITPLGNFNGYHIGYERVVENHNTNGSIAYRFHQDLDFNVIVNESYPYSPQLARVRDGHQKESKTFIESFTIPVSSSSNLPFQEDAYIFLEDHIIYKAYEFGFNGGGSSVYAKPYTIRTAPYRVSSRTETIDGVATTTTFEYGSDQHLAPTATEMTNSDDKITRTETKYAHEMQELEGSNPTWTEMIDYNMIGIPIETTTFVGLQGNLNLVDGSQTRYNLYSPISGAVANIAGNIPYPHELKRYEATWDQNNNLSGNWELLHTINKYHPDGYPREATTVGWQPEIYEWHFGKIKKRTFQNYVWEQEFYPNTLLPSKIIAIDGQDTDIEYDDLIRPKTVTSRDGNIQQHFTYHYTNNPAGTNILNDYSYVNTRTDFTYTPNQGSELKFIETRQYMDGLGRVIQNVQRQHAPDEANPKDIISAIEYDPFNRVSRTYEPFISTSNNGAYKSIPSGTKSTLTTYRPSPLNRIFTVRPPDWHSSATSYNHNETEEVIKDFNTNEYYPANSLMKVTTRDPNNNKMIQFTDKKGRLILSRSTNNDGSQQNDTYRIYDDKNREIIILPPNTDLSSPNDNLIFTYRYDGADNVLNKKIPDAAEMNMLYDDRDLLTYIQDGNQLANNRWIHTQYDSYGRMTKTGFYNNTPANGNITQAINLSNLLLENIYGTTGIEIDKLKTTKAKILDGNNNFIQSTFTYDVYGRINLSRGNNYLNVSDFFSEQRTFAYDFADNILSEQRDSKRANGTTLDIDQRWTYDHEGRLLETYHQLENGTEQLLSDLVYDHEDQIIERRLGGTLGNPLQNLDYQYNEQGWLTQINQADLTNPNGLNTNSNSKVNSATDLFYLQLNYDNSLTNFSTTPQKNGNISQAVWRVLGSDRQAYNYSYDYLDRLTEADYAQIQDAGNLINNDRYNSSYDYDARGNFDLLTRNGYYLDSGTWKQGAIDNMDYKYIDGSNQIEQIFEIDCLTSLVLSAPINDDQIHRVSNTIESTSIIDNNANVSFYAGQSITLNAGFEVKAGSQLLATIEDCTGATANANYAEGYTQVSTDNFTYDPNGNLLRDPHKAFTITYNYLNLPKIINFDSGDQIEFTYTADGTKIRKTNSGSNTDQRDYIAGIEYKNTTLEAIYHNEGRVIPDAASFKYQYNITDHLGNSRVCFEDDNNDNIPEIIQQNHYYAFGMEMTGTWNNQTNPKQPYLYNGKEFNDDFGLNLLDFGARWQDPVIGRFLQVDPLANNHISMSPFNYVMNNPLSFIDPDGRDTSFADNKARNLFNTTYNKISNKIDSYDQKISGTNNTKKKKRLTKKKERLEDIKLSFDDVITSEITFEFSTKPNPDMKYIEGGSTEYDEETGNIKTWVYAGLDATLVHEVRHGAGYERKEWGYDSINKTQDAYDYQDEYEGYKQASDYNQLIYNEKVKSSREIILSIQQKYSNKPNIIREFKQYKVSEK